MKKNEKQSYECHCFMLRNMTSLIKKKYNQYFENIGITNEQFTILEFLKNLEPISVTDLSIAIKLDRTTLSRNLKILKNKKLIIDEISFGRSKKLNLSEEGKIVIDRAEKKWNKAQKEIEDIIGLEKLEIIRESLKILEEKL